MDWLGERQEKIEQNLAAKHLSEVPFNSQEMSLPLILREPPVPWLNTAIRGTKRKENYKLSLVYSVTPPDVPSP
ncbi:hypothetical protein [Microcoleus sp. F4-D5]|uniref:hypothetical protein n=1 Tax=Microcoleus sp. F4-D5 TaxID=2818760 RepID=UPI002FD68CE7